MKKLLIFIPSIEDGGVEKNLFLIVNYISKKIKAIDIITCNYEYKNKFNKNINFFSPKISFIQKKERIVKYLFSLLFLVYYIVINNRKVVVLSFQANIYAIFIAKLFNVKIISRSNSSPSGWSKNFLKNFIFKRILKFADTIIVNSRDFQKQMYKKFLVKSICIYNPFYKEIIKKKIKENSKNYFLKNQLKLVAVGRLTEQKDFITLLKAINIIKTEIFLKLIIIGKGYEKKKLKTFINNNKLNNNVKLLGYTTNPFLIMKQSDAIILTSKFEGLPNVLLEAQFLKKYIISSNCPTGPKEILLNGKAGSLFKVGNYNDLAKKIINLKFNKKNNKKKILLGYRYFYRFDFKNNCEKYYEIVKKYL